ISFILKVRTGFMSGNRLMCFPDWTYTILIILKEQIGRAPPSEKVKWPVVAVKLKMDRVWNGVVDAWKREALRVSLLLIRHSSRLFWLINRLSPVLPMLRDWRHYLYRQTPVCLIFIGVLHICMNSLSIYPLF